MHHHTGSSPIIYIMEELKIQGEQLPIIKGFDKTYVMAGDENTTNKYNDMVDEVNKRKDAFKEQHLEATEEEIIESVQSQQIQQLQEVQELYEQRLKESEERAQQEIQEVKQRVLRAESMYSAVQS
ncbi:hypothetical protein ACLB2K_030991 [Fragaria x ananassa]